MDDERGTKSVKLPTLDGELKKFQLWWVRFMAYATVFKFIKALTIGGESILTGVRQDKVIPDMDTDKNAKEAAQSHSALAMASLTMAFTSDVTMGLVYKAMTTDWPSGLAHMVVEALFKKYQPQDTITRVELRLMLNGVKMKKGSNPATIFEQLSTIKNRYNTMTRRLDDEDKIAVVLSAAPDEYQAMLMNEQWRLGANITTEDLAEVMNQYWRQVTAKEGGPNESDDTELTLLTFSGKCYNCGEEGHKSNECKKPRKNKMKSNRKGSKKNLKCYNCGRPNHIRKDCWEKDENKDKRPRMEV
jgi:gag-polypeptide of LTR copia-type/Zinc knuckle